MTININGREFDYLTLRRAKGLQGGIDILGWGTYPDSSVLAGQPMKVFLDNVPDEATARQRYPDAKGFSHHLLDPQVSVAHLPGPDDQRPGGAWPDDIGA